MLDGKPKGSQKETPGTSPQKKQFNPVFGLRDSSLTSAAGQPVLVQDAPGDSFHRAGDT